MIIDLIRSSNSNSNQIENKLQSLENWKHNNHLHSQTTFHENISKVP